MVFDGAAEGREVEILHDVDCCAVVEGVEHEDCDAWMVGLVNDR